ncbi:hypothetical protein [Pseudomonas sp. TWI628]|uniref:hypothetical protein n=1 Tax=Pseudomonas sp. TWI628 TaxID=3136788 RepID=UPI00320B1216
MTTKPDMKLEELRRKEELHAMADQIIKGCEENLRDLAKRGDKRAQAEVLKRGLAS